MPDTYAKTAHTAGEAWAASLRLETLGWITGTPYDKATVASMQVAALGGMGTLMNTGGTSGFDTWAHKEVIYFSPPNPVIEDLYFPFRLRVQAPGMMNYDDLFIWVFAVRSTSAPPGLSLPVLPGGVTKVTCPLSYDIACTISDLVLCRKRTSASYDDRQSPLDPAADQTVSHTWFAGAGATVTVTGDGLSAFGPLAGAGAEINMGTGFNFAGAIVNNHFPTADTTYGKISAISCFGHSLSMGSIILYNPGQGTAPSAAYPDWKRQAPASGAYLLLKDDGGVALQRSAASTSGGTGGFAATAPVTLNYHGDFARRWDPEGDLPSGLKVTAEPRDWVDGAWVAHEWNAGEDYSQSQFPVTWAYEYEYRFLSESGIAQITQASRVEQGEDVGGTTIAQNDAQVLFVCQPLTAGVTGNPIWGPFLGLSPPTLLNVDLPSGLSERPSLWTGAEGVTVDPANNALWTVTAEASSPAVSRAYKNRYELRMARLSGGYTPGLSYNTDWPFMLKANLSDAVTQDDPQWIAAVPYEDIWNWANYSYLGFQVISPVAGTCTITVTYKVPTLSDPCYTCAEHR